MYKKTSSYKLTSQCSSETANGLWVLKRKNYFPVLVFGTDLIGKKAGFARNIIIY